MSRRARVRRALPLALLTAVAAAYAQQRPDAGTTLDTTRDLKSLPRADEPVVKKPDGGAQQASPSPAPPPTTSGSPAAATAPASAPTAAPDGKPDAKPPQSPAAAEPGPPAAPPEAADTDPEVVKLKKLEAGIAKQLEIMSFQMDALRQELTKLRGQIEEYAQESRQARLGKAGTAVAGAPAGAAAAAPGAPAEPIGAKPGEPPAEPGPPTVAVAGFRFTGASAIEESQLAARVERFVGQKLTMEELEAAARAARQAYLDRGYFLAQAYLPEQDIKDGVVEIAILEGRLGRVQVDIDETANIPESLVRGIIAKHLKSGDLITETSLEKPLLLVRDLPRITAESTIQPGAEVGQADLIVRVKRSPNVSLLTGTVDFDNFGNRFTGEYRLGVTANLNNPFGLGDYLSFRGFIPDNTDTVFGRIGYVLPVWHYGTKVGLSIARLNYGIGQEFSSLQADGTADVLTAYVVHPIVRTRAANLFLQMAFEDKRLIDRQGNVGVLEERKIQSTKFQLSADARDRWLGLNLGSATLTLGEMQPVSTGLASADQSASGFKTAGRFTKWNFELQRLQQIIPDLNLLLSFSGQLASKNLTSAEKMSLGGPSGIRAYPVGEASGDAGYLGSLELRYTIPGIKLGDAELMVTGFYDFGQIKLNAKPEDAPPTVLLAGNKRTLAGWGLGLNIGRDGQFMVRSSIAWRLDEAPQSDLTARGSRQPRFWVQAIKWF